MSSVSQSVPRVEPLANYSRNRDGLREYLFHLADDLFPFPGYRDYQDEILKGALEALFIEGHTNVVIDGPTGIGKSPINVTLGRVISHLKKNKSRIEDHFNYKLYGIESGKSFYTTPQKQLRNQLANDVDLQEYVTMLKSRQDYICGASGDNCKDCSLPDEMENQSCRTIAGCTYWRSKARAMDADIAALTFAMLVVDNYLPTTILVNDVQEEQISFDNRDLVIVDEGHGLESQVASLFAGFTISPWTLPNKVYRNTDDKISWDYERFEDITHILNSLYDRATNFVDRHDEDPNKTAEVDQCKDFIKKVEYCHREVKDGRPWTVTVSKFGKLGQKKMVISPVDVDKFLERFIWSRGNKRVISSATIPYRENIAEWAERIGLEGSTKLISRPMPFPEEHRLIHKNTIVGSMSGDGEEQNWRKVINTIREIHSHHEGENGLIHTNSYQRAEKLADSLGHKNVIVQDQDKDKEEMIEEWVNSEKDILISPSMMEGVDLHGDRCRWQVLLKVPYPYLGDNRVSYLLDERNDWDWYMESASLDVQQSVGRAVRGPEPSEAASYYIIDGAFNKLMNRTKPPEWFTEAIRDEPPEHWSDPEAAPWRQPS
ncbi:Rad3-related DNA helicase [Haloarcula virus HJTV-1]|nr:Rad3-related DNA helicase [Haloarcula virus HJTV-1]